MTTNNVPYMYGTAVVMTSALDTACLARFTGNMTDLTREAVQRAAFALAAKRKAAAKAEDEFADSIRMALRNGVPATEVAELAGISRARVYQIRDGKR